ncbi:hypothetical protein EUV02_03780 [Polymorphobacter arshaanensis]|uniref:Uncharacterized protein n=1 Tax=Glacieibacterium arshaanense TaxID=2511025 RepID=A0A4Y9ERR0_9SPHN|nr:glycosyl hydrolase 108 family protein [Polymorphobacter arshaanensis]TFU06142.1 hypothetical protein EUV02_03780 [Polymorphobacter arshaanensis]
MTFGIESGLLDLLKVEGGYSNNPADKGGETNHGITIAVARANGYTGAMKDLPVSVAKEIYRKVYFTAPGFDKVASVNPEVAGELFDTGVNMGPATAAGFLQTALNALNRGGQDYPDISPKGPVCGPQTIAALTKYIKVRGADGITVLLTALNVLQGARYLEIATNSPKQETFVYGWLKNRVATS